VKYIYRDIYISIYKTHRKKEEEEEEEEKRKMKRQHRRKIMSFAFFY